MSKERYFELYRQFLNHSISKGDYEELMEWIADEMNDATLRQYMVRIWAEEGVAPGENPERWASFKNQFRSASQKRNEGRLRWWKAAAAVLILISASYALYQYFNPGQVIYLTAYGETMDIELDDGSTVVLNAHSTLEWDDSWDKTGVRKVRLTGEAFFDVRHTEDDHPFVVETRDLTVNVLGTTFNVRARQETTDVVLKTGKIKLDLKGTEDKALVMEPGDRVDYSSEAGSLERSRVESIAEPADWMEGVLRFEDVSVAEMFRKIEELYGKKLVTGDSAFLSRRMFTGIPYEDWSVAKQALELALGVKITEQENQLFIR